MKSYNYIRLLGKPRLLPVCTVLAEAKARLLRTPLPDLDVWVDWALKTSYLFIEHTIGNILRVFLLVIVTLYHEW